MTYLAASACNSFLPIKRQDGPQTLHAYYQQDAEKTQQFIQQALRCNSKAPESYAVAALTEGWIYPFKGVQ